MPRRSGALPLVVARTAIDRVSEVGVTIGVGDPAVCVARHPLCGCDACDSGSQSELDGVDRILLGVVSGTLRHLTSGDRQITQIDRNGWSASGSFERGEVEFVLADPSGWVELSGVPWTDFS